MPVELNLVESVTELDTTVVTVVLESASEPGPAGPGVPTGGTVGQVLTKDSGTDYDTSWQDATGGGGGAPTDATYLVTTANGSLSAEVVVGATPGGELGGTWASPTVDATHSGSSHADVQAAAEATADAALDAHEADTTNIHGIVDTSALLDTADIGVSVQAFDADLSTYAGITPSANVQSLLGAANYASMRSQLDLEAGTDFPSQATFDDHSARHENGGADEISIAGLDGTPTELTNHLNDTSAAHAASAVSVSSTTLSGTGTDVQAVFEEIDNLLDDHSSRHENGGADEISVAGLSGELADAQPLDVRKNSTGSVFTRSRLNFIEGSNVTLTVADDAGNDEVDITIASTGGSGGDADLTPAFAFGGY